MRTLRWVPLALLGLVLAGGPMGPGVWAADTAATEQAATERVNLNTATAEDLVRLKGIGEKTATAIVEYRDQNGPFRSVDELLQVKGIGKKKLEALRPFLTVE